MKNHNFEIEVPTSMKQAYDIYYKTGTVFFKNSIAKEILYKRRIHQSKSETGKKKDT